MDNNTEGKPWYKPRIPFWTAFRLWKEGGKGMVLEGITLVGLIGIGIQALVFTTVEFFTLKWLGHVWRKLTGKKSEE